MANGSISSPCDAAGEEPVGHVGASNQKHQSDSSQQDDQRLTDLVRQGALKPENLHSEIPVRWIPLGQPGSDSVHVGLSVLGCDARLEAGHDAEVMTLALRQLLERPMRYPHVGLADGKAKTRRHDAGHGVALAVDSDCPSDQPGIRTEATLPKAEAQDH